MTQADEISAFSDSVATPHGTDRILAETYRLSARIGAGAMGEVFEAEHVRLGKKVAVKLLRGQGNDERRARHRFRREARALASIDSEYVVGVFDYGALDDGTPYLVMERLVGRDLRAQLARSGALPVARALHIALDICHGLSAVHRAGIVHRDLKPANLFLTRRSNNEEICKILDLGVAKTVASEATHQGAVIGTVRYMAPEQLNDSASVSSSTDVYAVGAVLYECLTGSPPHDADSVQELMFRILNQDAPEVCELRPEVPAELGRIVMRALARDPSQRFETAELLGRELERLARQASTAFRESPPSDETEPDGAPQYVPSGRRDRPRILAGVTMGMLVALVGAFLLGRSSIPSPPLATARASSASSSSPAAATASCPSPSELDPQLASVSATAAPPAATMKSPTPLRKPIPAASAARARAEHGAANSFEAAQNPYAD